ncbi:MCE family protein [Skermania sp. ID1734]|uniref:MCE family protein n=1 Tax=Skermania sp. ID1734 TaxID=2597516 RepID=UPI00117C2F53|nr:MCE family protein [Skermania sp. ID1734]TSD96512.1 MCE family protein [Skermania sp. ID1734]
MTGSVPKRRWRRGFGVLAIVACTALGVTGCEWKGLNSLPLPGAQGVGADSYTVQIQMPNVTTLSQNSPVMVNDVTVGTVTDIEVQGWHALVTVSIKNDVNLPGNAIAKIGQTSLLGSNHVELLQPKDPTGNLRDVRFIPLDRAGAYPTTEQVLSSLSVVLNGGGLAQLQDITRELNTALDGRTDAVRDLLPQLNDLTTQLDHQRGDIVAALDGLNRLADTFARRKDVLTNALDGIPPALKVLVDERQNITSALVALGKLSDVTNRIVDNGGDNLKANLKNLVPVLKSLADTGNHLTDVLPLLITFPFSMTNLDHWLKGDYANLMMTVDLTGPRLDSNFLTGTGLGGVFGGVEGLLGRSAGVAGEAKNPMTAPLQPPPPAPAGAPAIPGLPQIPGLPAIPGLTAPAPGGPPR